MITAKVRQEVIWSGPCAYCGDLAPTTVDHVMPVSRGGTDDRGNLVPACRSCNVEKLTFTPEEWREWREAEGYGWPPKSRAERFIETAREIGEKAGMSLDEISRLLMDWARGEIGAEAPAEEEKEPTELERLTAHRAEVETIITGPESAPCRHLLLRRLAGIDERLAELRGD